MPRGWRRVRVDRGGGYCPGSLGGEGLPGVVVGVPVRGVSGDGLRVVGVAVEDRRSGGESGVRSGVVGVAGSAVGLLVVGALSDRSGGLASAMPVVAIGPALLAVLIVVAYPETAHLELEDINPEDR